MTSLFKVTIVQEKGDPYDRKWNTEKGLSIVKKGKERGADISEEK